MVRIKRGAKMMAVVTLVLVVLMFIPPTRNVLTLGYLPRLWSDISTFRILKAQYYSTSGKKVALSPCTQPAREASGVKDHRDPLQQLLNSEPFKKVQARPQDKAAHSKALTWLNQSTERKQRYSRFSPKMPPMEKTHLVLTWRVLHQALTLHNISHFLIDGTLLGAVRHGGITPWDDEMDIAVEEKDADRAQSVLSCIPGYVLRVQVGMMWKFFSEDAQVMNRFSKSRLRHANVLDENEKHNYVLEFHNFHDVIIRVPFVDIFLLTTDGSYFWSTARFNQKQSLYPVEDIYPLTRANFEGYSAPVPRRSVAIMNRMFDANECVSSSNDHFVGQEIFDISAIPCAEIAKMYTVYKV